jgi:hypothetical protein
MSSHSQLESQSELLITLFLTKGVIMLNSLVKLADFLDGLGISIEADIVDSFIKKLAGKNKKRNQDPVEPAQPAGPAPGSPEAIKSSGYTGLRGNVAIYEQDVPGGRQKLAYWPDSQGAYPTAESVPGGVNYTYPGPDGQRVPAMQMGDWELERAGKQKPQGFEDVSYFVQPQGQQNFAKDEQVAQQASNLLVVSALEMFGQARWDARLTAVQTGTVEKTWSAANEEELKKQVLSGVSGKKVKIASSTKNDQPITLNWGIEYQKQESKAQDS